MLVSELVKDIHENAVSHGWWEGERSPYEIAALIHSEWSEALEEARAGRGLHYHNGEVTIHVLGEDADRKINTGKQAQMKPEGVAVELIDGCIRIMDWMGACGVEIADGETGRPAQIESLYLRGVGDEDIPRDAATVVCYLHGITARVLPYDDEDEDFNVNALVAALSLAMTWVAEQGIDPLGLMLEKHEYNKTRPYKHGKKF